MSETFIEEMDEALVKNWNSVVGLKDKVYHLGDVVINRSALPIVGRLNGIKRLIKGNHDNFRAEEYLEYFKDIRAYGKLDDFVLSHIPLHPDAVRERWKGNMHGHLHGSRVMETYYNGYDDVLRTRIDTLYLCLSVEQIKYTPISFDEAKIIWEKQQ